jgi:hypothetical protein
MTRPDCGIKAILVAVVCQEQRKEQGKAAAFRIRH